MLFLVGGWVILLAASVPVGAAILRWLSGGTSRPPATEPAPAGFDRVGDRFVLCAWLGVLVLGSALLAASLVLPLSPIVGALVGFGAALAAMTWRAARAEVATFWARLSGRLALGALALAAGIGVATAQPVIWRDTGLYHASAIRWLSEHGTVEGVALVDARLGFGSSWFALASPLNPDGLRDHAMAVMGGFALLLLALHFVVGVARALHGRARPADWFLIAGSAFLIPTVVALQKLHVSASPDLPVAVLALLVGWAILAVAGLHGAGSATPRLSPGPAAIPLVLALGAMALKPQAGALVAVAALFYLGTGRRRAVRAAWGAVLGVVLVGPWVAHELVATGCPAYPLPICADVPWSVGSETARAMTEMVETFARWREYPAPGSGLEWIGPWLTDDLSPALALLAALSLLALAGGLAAGTREHASPARRTAGSALTVAGALGLFAFLLRAEEIALVTLAAASLAVHPLARRHPGAGWLLVLGLAGVALALYAAPDPRWALGYMAVLFGWLALVGGPAIWRWAQPRLNHPARLPRLGLTTLLLLAAGGSLLVTLARPTTTASEAFAPRSLVIPPEMTATVIVHPEPPFFRVPVLEDEGAFCWAAELPCTPAPSPNVGLRDPDQGIGGGFTRSGDGR